MKKRWLAITLASICTLVGCAQEQEKEYQQYEYRLYPFGTESIVRLVDEKGVGDARTEEVVTELNTLFKGIENSLSVEVKTSYVTKFNEADAGERITIDETTYEVLSIAMEMYELTDGAYNPAVGHLVDLWGFSPRFRSNYSVTMPYDREVQNGVLPLPEQKYVDGFSTLTNFGDIRFGKEGDSYYMVKPSNEIVIDGVTYTMKIDLGGLGKGYATDLGLTFLRSKGYTQGFISVGSSSIGLMQSMKEEDDCNWSLGFTHPRPILGGGNYLSVPVKDTFVSSSGDYENYYYIGETRYCHIIDPFTGKPIKSKACMATVIGLPAAQADALTTALLVMGAEKGVTFMQEHYPDVKYSIVKETYEMQIYTNLESYILLDKTMRVL